MEEFKFNNENNYSTNGERSGERPITVVFREDGPSQKPPKKRRNGGKVVLFIALGVILAGVSFGSGALGNRLFGDLLAPSDEESIDTQTEVTDAAETVPAILTPVETAEEASAASTTPIAPVVTPVSYAEVAAKTKPTVVEITTEMVSGYSYFQQFIQSGAGSGVIISQDGYIITNNHVIEGANKITVRLTTGEEYVATLIGTDAQSDIAIIKIDATGLPYANVGDSSKLVVGEEVLAIGNPLGSLGGSVTNGIISALDREITIDGQKMRLLQTNAAINPGNSGGGLFNMRGQLIAIVNAKSAGTGIEGLGFAIPINYAYEIAEDLMTSGYVSGRPIMGISYIAIDDYMDLMRYGVVSYGIYVYDGGDTPLQNGDRIVRIGDYEVQNVATLKSAIQSYKVGDTVKVTVVRQGTYTDLEVTLIEEKPVESNKIELTTEN